MSAKPTAIVALATQSAEKRLRLNPVAQVRRMKRWARERNWRVVRGFYFSTTHPVTGKCALSLAISEAEKHDRLIAVLDGAGQTVVLKVMEEGLEFRNADAITAQ